jgi:release factor glutamine methyltransferase
VGNFCFRGRRVVIEVPSGSGVLFPTDVGMSLLAALDTDPLRLGGMRVLDVGTGSGVHAVAFGLAGAGHVTALDINPDCAGVVAANLTRNGLDPSRVRCVTGDLGGFAAGSGFDLVVCNPPHFPFDPAYAGGGGLREALVGGWDGRVLYDLLLQRVDELLAAGGTLLLAHSSLTDIARTVRELTAAGFSCHTLLICELDIPMLCYLDHREVLLARLYELRAQGRAAFDGLRFEVHTLAFTRPSGAMQPGREPQ